MSRAQAGHIAIHPCCVLPWKATVPAGYQSGSGLSYFPDTLVLPCSFLSLQLWELYPEIPGVGGIRGKATVAGSPANFWKSFSLSTLFYKGLLLESSRMHVYPIKPYGQWYVTVTCHLPHPWMLHAPGCIKIHHCLFLYE